MNFSESLLLLPLTALGLPTALEGLSTGWKGALSGAEGEVDTPFHFDSMEALEGPTLCLS